ncbi:glycosyltransferase [Aquidulcibacter sp.]|jgi:hypothetical protein|uniref:glycosyltransferase n=1 Tax=Aquidulcibacter sp. TaxID=2052990 RepID=UPI0038C6F53E
MALNEALLPREGAVSIPKVGRIFHGMFNIAGIPGMLASQERKFGLNSKSYTFPSGAYSRETDTIIDRLDANFASWAVLNHDVFHFHFGTSLSGQELWDLRWLRRLGKKVYMHFHGCDIRDSKSVQEKYGINMCSVCWPMACNQNRNKARILAARYANKVFMSTPDLLEFIPGSVHLPQAVNIGALEIEALGRPYQPRARNSTGPIKILHAPSAADLKGSAYIEAALSRLISEGLPIEVEYMTGFTHQEVVQRMAESDLLIDQLLAGAHGVVGIEAMALGVPVINYIRPDIRHLYPSTLPIIQAEPSNIGEVVADFVKSRHTHSILSTRSRAYALAVHSVEAVTARMIRHY